jgi:small subunit ribosomal protein S20
VAKRTKSGLKRKRQALKRMERNRGVQSMIKTLVKKVRQVAAPAAEDIRAVIRALDAAARKGILHPNAAARKKSRLTRRTARAGTAS